MNLNEIVILAHSLKTNKKEAFNIIRSACDNDGKMSAVEMALLYRYFIPNVPKKPKTKEQWVQLAVGKKDVRSYLNFAYCDGDRFIGCDGHRFHYINSNNLPAKGFYNKAGDFIGTDHGVYPDMKRVMPNMKLAERIEFDQLVIEDHKGGMQIYRYNGGGIGFNKKYIDEAISLSDEFAIWHVDNSIYIEHHDGYSFALVMGLRV